MPPWLQHRLERSAVEVWTEPALKQLNDAETANGRVHGEVDRRTQPDCQGPGRIDPQYPTVAPKLPRRRRAAREPPAQAGMIEQVAGMRWSAMRVKYEGDAAVAKRCLRGPIGTAIMSRSSLSS